MERGDTHRGHDRGHPSRFASRWRVVRSTLVVFGALLRPWNVGDPARPLWERRAMLLALGRAHRRALLVQEHLTGARSDVDVNDVAGAVVADAGKARSLSLRHGHP